MAIYNVFTVYDEKAEAFLPPFILPKVAQAERVFRDCINSTDHQFGQNPADYTLFRLGNFDDENGQFLLERSKQSLGNGVEYLQLELADTDEDLRNGQDTSIQAQRNVASLQSDSTGENSTE